MDLTILNAVDATKLNTIVGVIGIISTVIGIIVGIIGGKSLTTAIKIKNNVKADTVQQAQVINNGLDNYAVIKLSQDTTREELEKIVKDLREETDKKIAENRIEIVRLYRRRA